MKLLFKIASTIMLSQYLGVFADEPVGEEPQEAAKVEEVQAAEEIEPSVGQVETPPGGDEIEDLPFEINE